MWSYQLNNRIQEIGGKYRKGRVVGFSRCSEELLVLWDGLKKPEFRFLREIRKIGDEKNG